MCCTFPIILSSHHFVSSSPLVICPTRSTRKADWNNRSSRKDLGTTASLCSASRAPKTSAGSLIHMCIKLLAKIAHLWDPLVCCIGAAANEDVRKRITLRRHT